MTEESAIWEQPILTFIWIIHNLHYIWRIGRDPLQLRTDPHRKISGYIQRNLNDTEPLEQHRKSKVPLMAWMLIHYTEQVSVWPIGWLSQIVRWSSRLIGELQLRPETRHVRSLLISYFLELILKFYSWLSETCIDNILTPVQSYQQCETIRSEAASYGTQTAECIPCSPHKFYKTARGLFMRENEIWDYDSVLMDPCSYIGIFCLLLWILFHFTLKHWDSYLWKVAQIYK